MIFLLSSFYRWENRGREKLKDMSKVTELVNGEAGIWTQVPEVLCSFGHAVYTCQCLKSAFTLDMISLSRMKALCYNFDLLSHRRVYKRVVGLNYIALIFIPGKPWYLYKWKEVEISGFDTSIAANFFSDSQDILPYSMWQLFQSPL